MAAATSHRAEALWIVLFTLVATGTTLALACATPFTALAALAATQFRRLDGLWLMGVAWLASQLVGFCVLDYPRDPTTLAWGFALLTAALAAAVAARRLDPGPARYGVAGRLLVAYLVAAVAFKAVVLLWSFGLGGVATTLSPAINFRQLVRNGAILVGLYLLYRGLVAAGVPRLGSARMATA